LWSGSAASTGSTSATCLALENPDIPVSEEGAAKEAKIDYPQMIVCITLEHYLVPSKQCTNYTNNNGVRTL
jgi:hypothetical protein